VSNKRNWRPENNKPKEEELAMKAILKQARTWMTLGSLLLGVMLTLSPRFCFAQNVASHEQAGSLLTIDNVTVQDGSITGQIRNQSKNTMRDVQLFIRYNWLWANERHPGKDSPSGAFYPTMAGEIAPGGSMPFNFTPSPPLPNRSGGKFEAPFVSIAGFTQVIPQNR
jgi:hypothetical protein